MLVAVDTVKILRSVSMRAKAISKNRAQATRAHVRMHAAKPMPQLPSFISSTDTSAIDGPERMFRFRFSDRMEELSLRRICGWSAKANYGSRRFNSAR